LGEYETFLDRSKTINGQKENQHGSVKMEAAWWPGGGPECPKCTEMEICDASRIDFPLGKIMVVNSGNL